MFLRVLVLSLLSLGARGQDEREPRFLSGLLRAGADVQRQMESLQRQMSSVGRMGSELGYLSRNIEDQISDSLPPYLRAHPAPLEEAGEGVEAIVGRLGGDAVDDGLSVIMEGDEISLPSPEAPETPESPAPVPAPAPFPAPAPAPADGDSPLHGNGFRWHLNMDNVFGGLFMDTSGLGLRWGERPLPWWRGENVCVQETVVAEGENSTSVNSSSPVFRLFSSSMESKSCVDNGDVYTCTTRMSRRGTQKTVTEEFACCHGYRRKAPGYCTEVSLKTMEDTLKDLGFTKLVSMARSASIDLDTANLTVFAPSNEALEDFVFDMEEDNGVDITSNEVYRRRRAEDPTLAHTLTAHFAKGILQPGALRDEQLLEPMWGPDQLRVNVYRSRAHSVVTVNCAKITGDETPSTHGMVYQVDSVISPAKKTLAEIIETDPQFSKFHEILRQGGALERLASPGNTEGHFTLLAPTDAAFAAMAGAENWLANGPCSGAVAKNHILPNTICSAAIVNPQSRTLNLLGNYLKVRLDHNDKMFVGDAQIISKDIIASNGVMHIIDAPLIPSEAKSVLEVLESRNLTEFLSLLKEAELEEELALLEGATIFAPTNEAVREAREYLDTIKHDRPALQAALRYHLAASDPAALLRNNLLADTHAGHPLRMNVYTGPMVLGLYTVPARRSRVTAGCARVALTGARACGAAVHEVSSLLLPPEGTVADQLQDQEAFSIFSKMARDSSLGPAYQDPSSALTVLAPSDHVFRTLPQRELDLLLADQDLQEELVKKHTLTEHVCCAGVAPASLLQERSRTAHGSSLHFRRTAGGAYRAGAGRVTRCGSGASNGVLHTVDRLFVAPPVAQRPGQARWAAEESRPLFAVSPDRMLGDIFRNMFVRH